MTDAACSKIEINIIQVPSAPEGWHKHVKISLAVTNCSLLVYIIIIALVQ